MQFHFDQSKVRYEIRLREGRTKPIDVLLKNLSFSDEFDVELNEPYLVFKVSIICSSLCHCSLNWAKEKNPTPAAFTLSFTNWLPALCNIPYGFQLMTIVQ